CRYNRKLRDIEDPQNLFRQTQIRTYQRCLSHRMTPFLRSLSALKRPSACFLVGLSYRLCSHHSLTASQFAANSDLLVSSSSSAFSSPANLIKTFKSCV